MTTTKIGDIILTRRDSFPTSDPSTASCPLRFSTPNSSTTTVATTSTQKLDMVRSPSSIGSTYTGPLDFLDNQSSFDCFPACSGHAACYYLLFSCDLRVPHSSIKTFNYIFLEYSLTTIRWNRNLRFQPDDV